MYSLVLGACALLMACGSKDDGGGAPVLESGYFGEISPFDTLRVKFDQSIETPVDSQLISEYKVRIVGVEKNVLTLVGADTTLAGFPRFSPGVSNHLLQLKGIGNKDGDVQEQLQSLSFATYAYLDKDYTCEASLKNCVMDYKPEDGALLSPTGNAFFNGASLNAGVKAAGLLMLGSGPKVEGLGSVLDYEDHYLMPLKMGDSIEITLQGYQQNLNLYVWGSQDSQDSSDFGKVVALDTAGVPTQRTLKYRIGSEHSDRAGNRAGNSLANFAIKVAYHTQAPLGPTPYVLSVRLAARQFN